MKVEQLSLADYNKIKNIPVVNQDLSASGFTPVASTYYRHTGATTSTFTQGVIYYYDGTEYKALDGAGGGTTLNKYTLNVSYANRQRLINVLSNAKGNVLFGVLNNTYFVEWQGEIKINSNNMVFSANGYDYRNNQLYTDVQYYTPSNVKRHRWEFTDTMTRTEISVITDIVCIYYNDTEIV